MDPCTVDSCKLGDGAGEFSLQGALVIQFLHKLSHAKACLIKQLKSVTTTLGLLPMAIGIPNKSISWAPMATAFVSGLMSATVLTLLITPANYEAFEQFKAFIRRTFRRKVPRGELTRDTK